MDETKAVVYHASCEVRVEDVPDPNLLDPLDAVVRLTSSALCGSDLHMYEGRTPPEAGLVLGHEGLGVITEVGGGVRLRKPGERVVMPAHVYCGVCVKCAAGQTAQCLTMRPGAVGAAFGYAGKGQFRGRHAELVRVPFADANMRGGTRRTWPRCAGRPPWRCLGLARLGCSRS